MSNSPFFFKQSIDLVADNIEKTLSQWPKAQEVLRDQLDTEIAKTPYSVIYEEDRVKLKHYSANGNAKNQKTTPLFIVYALINRETMLDLQPDRSVVQQLLNSGIDLYMLDWGYPSRKDRFQDIDEHVNGYINNAVDVILKRSGVDQLNLMGVCMGGTFCTIYSALHPEKVKNLILTVSPTNFDTDEGLLHKWWGGKSFDVDRFVATQGNVPGDYLNANFLLLNPAKLIVDKYVGFAHGMHNKDFVQNFIRMEQWIFDSPDVPGETFREFVKYFYQENRLIQDNLTIGGMHVDLDRITMPVLNIYAQFDHLVPPSACNQITSRVGSTDTEDLCIQTGHIGIYVSSKSQKVFAPSIIRWLKERDGKEKARYYGRDVGEREQVQERMQAAGRR